MTRREWLVSTGVVLAIAVAYVAIAAGHGALDVARSDDWSFVRVAQDLAASGEVRLTGWVQMFFLGQLVLAAPLVAVGATSILSLHLFVALLSAGVLWLSYAIARRFLAIRWAVLSVAVLALGPMFGTLAVTFLSDVPAMLLALASLLTGIHWLETRAGGGRGTWWLAACIALGLWAFTVREYGVLAIVAVLGTVVVSSRWGSRSSWSAITGIVGIAVVCLGLLAWRRGLPGSTPTSVGVNAVMDQTLPTVMLVALGLALFTLPAVLVSSPVRTWREGTRVRLGLSAGWVVLVLAGLLLVRTRFPLGDFLTVYGSYPGTVVGGLDVVFLERPAIAVVAGAAAVGLLLVGPLLLTTPGSVVRRAPVSVRAVALFVGLMVVLFAGMSAALPVVFDRYLVVVVPLLASLLLWLAVTRDLVVRGGWRAVPVVALAGLAMLGLLTVDYAATVDGGKWRAARAAVDLGFPARAVEGGFEWFSYHQPGTATWRPDLSGDQWWVTLFDQTPLCATVVKSPDGVPDALADVSVSTLLGRTVHFSVLDGPDTCREA